MKNNGDDDQVHKLITSLRNVQVLSSKYQSAKKKKKRLNREIEVLISNGLAEVAARWIIFRVGATVDPKFALLCI